MTGNPGMPMRGGCQCGNVRYEITGKPLTVYICHCRECQKQSASAFGISVMVRSDELRRVSGSLKCWTRSADSGRSVACFFCAHCGSRVFHGDWRQEETIAVKGGSLDEPPDLQSVTHIWTSRRLPGVAIPEHCERFDQEPV